MKLSNVVAHYGAGEIHERAIYTVNHYLTAYTSTNVCLFIFIYVQRFFKNHFRFEFLLLFDLQVIMDTFIVSLTYVFVQSSL